MDQTIGKYKIVREIGKGGMGIVYKAMDPAGQKTVAVKVLPHNLVDRSTVERFNREAAALSRLKHPNLIEIFEVGMVKGEHFYVMEYIEGDTLKAMLAHRGALPASACLDITRQVAAALACVHAEGMIHRDIKPGNIMITTDGRIKLMDFGLVQVAGATRVTVEGSSVGTVEYMSPEQISEDTVDSRSDIYSLGATMYEMLAGRPPFQGDSFQSVMMKNKFESPPPLRELHKDIPPEVEQIVLKALAKDVSRRYQKVQDLLDDIKRIHSGPERKMDVPPAGTSADTPRPQEPQPARSSARPRTFYVMPFIFGVIAVAGLAFIGYGQRDQMGDVMRKLRTVWPGWRGRGDLTGEAKDYFERLEAADAYFFKGQEYSDQGMYAEAAEEYRRAIESRDDYGLYHRELARTYEALGDKDAALRAWQDLLDRAPGSNHTGEAQKEIERLSR